MSTKSDVTLAHFDANSQCQASQPTALPESRKLLSHRTCDLSFRYRTKYHTFCSGDVSSPSRISTSVLCAPMHCFQGPGHTPWSQFCLRTKHAHRLHAIPLQPGMRERELTAVICAFASFRSRRFDVSSEEGLWANVTTACKRTRAQHYSALVSRARWPLCRREACVAEHGAQQVCADLGAALQHQGLQHVRCARARPRSAADSGGKPRLHRQQDTTTLANGRSALALSLCSRSTSHVLLLLLLKPLNPTDSG